MAPQHIPAPWPALHGLLGPEIALCDDRGRIAVAGSAIAALARWDPADLRGRHLGELVSHAAFAVTSERLSARAPSGSDQDLTPVVTTLRGPGGAVGEVWLAWTSVDLDGVPWHVVAGANAREREDLPECVRRAQRTLALAASEDLYHHALTSTMAPMLFTDKDDQIVFANGAFCELVGLPLSQILGGTTDAFTHEEDRGIARRHHEQLVRATTSEVRYQKRYRRGDGRVVSVEVQKSVLAAATGSRRFVVSVRDVSALVQRDRFLTLLSAVHRIARLAHDERDYLNQLCDTLVEAGAYPLAWVATLDGNNLEVVAAAGVTQYIPETSTWHRSAAQQGPTLSALRTGQRQVHSDVLRDPIMAPWHDRAGSAGLRSSVALALRLPEGLAALNVYEREVGAFDEAECLGLEEIVHEAELALAFVMSTREATYALEDARRSEGARQASERHLRESEERFRLAFHQNMAPMVFTGLDDHVLEVNAAFSTLVGYEPDELIGRDTTWFTHPDDRRLAAAARTRLQKGEEQVRYSKRFVRSDGRTVTVDVLKSAVRDDEGRIAYFIASELDVTEERALAEQLRHRALHDPLTGLANRTLFEERLRRVHDGRPAYAAVLLVDLDDFKGVNDTYGHQVGDRLLIGIARRLELVTRATDTLSRMGGDEFLYLAAPLGSPDEVRSIAERLLGVFDEPFALGGVTLHQRASVGVALVDPDLPVWSDVIGRADLAMYEAKRRHRGRVAFYAPDLGTHASREFTLAQNLERAVRHGDLCFHYQPIVSIASLQVVGFEALARWPTAAGWISPTAFIPIAEQSDLIMELGVQALDDAVAHAVEWSRASGSAPFVSVNLSGHQFRDRWLPDLVEATLARHGLTADRLVLEVTESVAMADLAATRRIVAALHRLGVGLALDDFGTGHSSLSYLLGLDPRMVKIDRSFLDEGESGDIVLDAVVALGHDLGVATLAEGVETFDQLKRLRRLGCSFAQGFLFSPAVPADEVPLLAARRPREWTRLVQGLVNDSPTTR